ncbi:sugar ABC transporter ATP-binding protein [Plantibacter sp. MCCC 1A11337]|uniref:Monosaccharide ABC transporter ATP-binding protein (CUT2 family) n=1 Tax=Plantibacter flavus TaxID=150123 RepID=A0A1S7B5T1_9MICO|nr:MULTISPECIES: sugar ABC transporter ATP-binding protein [Plantibacter]AQX79003.1 sugar ABC transporter ATP-binding protein [Plantibacter flavus]NUJ88429.1 sugar ABC transporter ATP-binding protein [Plantibacter sp. MCCC 1A11337]OAN33766.1 sugar ABC transporter ATP-binding protein [Plantibacter sp. H53]OII39201.1 sugar ABC transporter ATP-binding protein [Plantibacter sp. MMLR14_011]ROR80280.1 monosaccharide ABC transporter ATP-binding protein (CUT2 family) [Plantibacter flavus]
MAITEPIVEMQHISIEFPGVKALQDVDFRLFPGEVHTLMGENGAGKSTLIKALTGVYKIDSGTILVAGGPRSFSGTADAQSAGISTVYQEVNLCDNLTVGENVMLGHEVRGPFGINWRRTHEAAHEALVGLGLGHIDPKQPLSSISLALQQLVAISRAMVTKSKVLILDEPTSSLDANEVEGLFQVMRRLRDQGVAILFVSHFLDQVYAISDRLTVLRNGEFVGEYRTADLNRTELISKMIGKDYGALAALGSNRGRTATADTPAFYSAKDLGRKGSIDPVDIEVHAGEVVGLAGLLGSGRTELGRLIYGADRPDSGTVTIDGATAEVHTPMAGLSKQIAFSTENRRDEGIIGDLTVRENLILAVQARRGWARPLSRREQNELCDKYLLELNVRPSDPERPIKNLSGGNQQKVLLGRWLATKPQLIVLDEPTRGIDVGAKAEIQEAIAALAEDGMSVVFISSELEEVVRLSERIVVLKDHRKIGEIVNGPEVTADTIVDLIATEGSAT